MNEVFGDTVPHSSKSVHVMDAGIPFTRCAYSDASSGDKDKLSIFEK